VCNNEKMEGNTNDAKETIQWREEEMNRVMKGMNEGNAINEWWVDG
jgi:hypothetical protein